MSPTPDQTSSSRAALHWLRLRWDRAAEAVLLALSAVVLIATWRSVSHTPFVADQLSYLASGGVAGLFLLAIGLRLRITGDLRDEWHKLDRIEAALAEAALSGERLAVVMPEENGHAASPTAAAPPSETRRSQPEQLGAGSQRGAVAVTAIVVVTLALFVVGWWRAAHASAVSTAFVGFAVAAAAGVLLTAEMCAPAVSLRRRLGQRKAELLAPFLVTDTAGRPPDPTGGRELVVIVPGLTRFHRPGCPAVAGLATRFSDRAGAAATLQSCEICAAG